MSAHSALILHVVSKLGCWAQAALTSWVQLCEAMASWRMMQDEGLRNELTLLLQAFKANLVSFGPAACCKAWGTLVRIIVSHAQQASAERSCTS